MGLILAGRGAAQTFTTLYNFTNGTDGAMPFGGLILSGNNLYGTTYGTEYESDTDDGTVFALNPNTMQFTSLHAFTPTSGSAGLYGGGTNSDGGSPYATLVLSGSTLYGTTSQGGTNGNGVIFALDINSTNLTILHAFAPSSGSAGRFSTGTNSDGMGPLAGLLLSDGTLYGTTAYGSTNGNGTVFAVSTNGTNFTVLHSFTAVSGSHSTNSDGACPYFGVLTLSGGLLYGTAVYGGANGNGTVFAVTTNGAAFTNLYSFPAATGTEGFNGVGINSAGANPRAGVILSGNTLYGTTANGGTNGYGGVFALNIASSVFTPLYSFTAPVSGSGNSNNDGAYPESQLILSGSTLYGTARYGGTNGNGSAFAVNTNGAAFTNLHSFTDTSGGFTLIAGVILSDDTLYGMTQNGGMGYGTVFGLSLGPLPELSITLSGTNVVLTWTNTATGYTLQSTTNLSPANWTPVSAAPVVINGQNTVTNPASGAQMFYQLSQ